MPDEPNRNVEDQLKAWAQKRREDAGAPFELHPATRKLLQEEVARTFQKRSAEPAAQSGGWWKMFWPRVALAGSICALLVILAGLSLPALSKAKAKAQRITAFNYLKQIGLAARTYASDHDGKLPANFQQMRGELGGAIADKLVKDPESGKEFVYLGAEKVEGDHDSILAYSPGPRGRRPVLLADGYVQEMDETQFKDALQRTLKGQTTVVLAAAPATSTSPASMPPEQQVLVEARSKDARLKEIEQPAKVETPQRSEKGRELELALADKRKEASPPPAGTSAATRGLNVENERSEVLLRQRYGLAPAQAGGVAARGDAPADQQRPAPASPAAPIAGPRVNLQVAKSGQGVGGAGGGGVTASNAAPGLNVPSNNAQNGATTDAYVLTLARQAREAIGGIVSPAQQRETDRLGTGKVYGYYARVPATQIGREYAQAWRYRVNFNSPAIPNVLRSFRVEQTGGQIRVLDADGSVYDGAIEQPQSEEFAKRSIVGQTAATELGKNIEPEAKRAERVSAMAAGETPASQGVFFRVAGTNRTLNQLVVFQGNFLANTSQTNGVFPGAKLAANQPVNAPQQNRTLQSQQFPDASIQGQATIGDRNRIQVNAVPVER